MKVRAQIAHGAEPRQMHRVSHLLGHLQECLDQPRRGRIRLVQQCRDQARAGLSHRLGEPGPLEGRLGAAPARAGFSRGRGAKWRILANIFANPHLPEIDDYYEPFDFDYDHLKSAPEMEAFPHRAAAFEDQRRADREDRQGPELGGDPGRRVREARPGLQLRGHPEADLRRIRKHLHDVSAAAVRALPESGLRRLLPLGRDLQARGGRHRPDRSGEMPRLADVRLGLPLQEGLLQLVHRQVREMHPVLSAHRVGQSHRLLGNLRRAHPLHRRDAL
ncbi:MAG: hypothetical protein KatS3mg118_2129 [Paracoccaceae bacterium]|nr:MAG: hypothetical protein KatS3mg118_2129 [Paracoccaceae bacterium]